MGPKIEKKDRRKAAIDYLKSNPDEFRGLNKEQRIYKLNHKIHFKNFATFSDMLETWQEPLAK